MGVGIAATKTLAKVANRQAKRTGGVYVLEHGSAEGRTLLDGWEVQELWGVAGRLATRLAAMGIHTAGELARAPRELLRRQLGVVGERMGLELQGVSCLELETMVPPRQNDPSLILRRGLCERKNTANEREESNGTALRP